MTTASEVSRVAAILREDIARAKADDLTIARGAMFQRLPSDVLTCCAIGALVRRAGCGRTLAAASEVLGIRRLEADAIVAGFDTPLTHCLFSYSEARLPWAILGRELAREEGLS